MKCLPLPAPFTSAPTTLAAAVLTVAFGAALVPAGASAFYAQSRSMDDMGNPVPIAYDTETAVEFRIDSAGMPEGDGSEVESIANAFATWAAVECVSIDFVQGERVDATPRHWQSGTPGEPDFERYISVYWSDDPEIFPNPGVAFFDWAHDGTGELIGGSIILNSKDHDWSTTGEEGILDVQSIVTAMVGRVLGITSGMEGNATYPRYAPGDTSKRTLGEDDIAGITYIYGDDTCEMRGEPEMICEGIDPLEVCPPTVPAGDGGTGPGTRDAATGPGDTGTGGTDTGTGGGADGGVDGGTDPGASDGGGCSVGGIDAGDTPGWIAILLVVGLALIRKR